MPVLQYTSKLLHSIPGIKIYNEYTSSRQITFYTEILSKLMEQSHEATLSVIVDHLNSSIVTSKSDEDDAKYLIILRSLSKSISLFTREQLQEHIAFFCRLGITHVNSEEIQLRQASILLLSELYLPLKDLIFPYIELLSVTQRKLLMIYVEKKKGQNVGQHTHKEGSNHHHPRMQSIVDI